MVLRPVAYRFSVEEYHRMGEAGILGPDDRVELLDGEVVQMTPFGTPHAACVDLPAAIVEVHRDPSGAGYRDRSTVSPGDSISPLGFDDLTFAVSDILGA
ncbi:MAG: Uma2 family endonuclease [Actinomycetota bacterium]|nr:Uma2 family endonuclease [Actinomycetota bacterium]